MRSFQHNRGYAHGRFQQESASIGETPDIAVAHPAVGIDSIGTLDVGRWHAAYPVRDNQRPLAARVIVTIAGCAETQCPGEIEAEALRGTPLPARFALTDLRREVLIALR